MYVELTYTYYPLFGSMFVEEKELRQEAAYTVRDAREIGKEPTNNVTAARDQLATNMMQSCRRLAMRTLQLLRLLLTVPQEARTRTT